MTVLEFYDGYVLNYFLAGSCNVPELYTAELHS